MFEVIWRDSALDELADAFVLADMLKRHALEQAVLKLNAQLAAEPFDLGESRDGDDRVAFEKPCAINYWVDNLTRMVRVTHFRTY